MIIPKLILKQIENIPPLSDIVTTLAELINDENSRASQFAEAIRYDPTLTATVLKVANSSFYGRSRKVTGIESAVSLLGLNLVYETALAHSLKMLLPKVIPGYEISATGFWRHSVGVALISEKIIEYVGMEEMGSMFTPGLLHDVGKLVVGVYLAKYEKPMLKELGAAGIPLRELEKRYLGIDHCEVGAIICENWKLPSVIADACRYHHSPHHLPGSVERNVAMVIHVADGLAHSMGLGADFGELNRKIEHATISELGLKVRHLEEIAAQTLFAIADLADIFVE